ncbi:MAG: branched-chain amino acid transport system substrate-binding protein, partial [Gaiellaceae bacterium]|nr:branched-chain amino acid transport system substrate-binding protein [Gaiellaceae bacterium]
TAKALNWKPGQIVINSVSAIDTVMAAAVARAGADFVAGSISTTYLKNVTNPAYGRDPWVRQYRRLVAKYGPPGVEVNNENTYYGVAKGYDIVKTLYLAGKHPTRKSLMAATLRMNWVNPYTIKGVKVKTGKTDHFPLSQVRLIRYANGSWNEFGPLIKGR